MTSYSVTIVIVSYQALPKCVSGINEQLLKILFLTAPQDDMC